MVASPQRLVGIGTQVKQSRAEIVAFVGSQILPHEADVRAWLRRTGSLAADVDDIVQETYCRLAALETVSHIASGRAYFFRTARNIAIERIRRARIVRIDCVTEIDALNVVDDEPSPERVVAGRRELRRVQALIEGLPERCRQIFTLRRIHGLSQREVATRLGVTENVVEAQAMRGLRLVLRALSETSALDHPSADKGHDRVSVRKRDR
ncbi:RNA polymerase sigma factor, sigma-70 family [Caulobacter sp. AP07]|uniref:RNA polymerase sigma factor n=1 Tax=Caulobacter sp. AP07 TaxID=1144304 RepID=UPI000271E36A|nr:RNA polymerase sigma factor [Caulobacter sp. AP07]EJL36098.1 RNA polymerase sigma factor, sigma-70 family [Caulobacter sp. AP07]